MAGPRPTLAADLSRLDETLAAFASLGGGRLRVAAEPRHVGGSGDRSAG